MTLLEIMIATAVLVVMMTMAWSTISGTSNARRTFLAVEERNHEIRVALARVVADFEAAYLSLNEDTYASDRRTMFIAKSSGDVPEIRFSTLGHMPLWGDANESEQNVIAYSAASTLFFLDLLRPGGEAARQWAPRVLLVGAVLHAAHVVTGSLLSRVCPVESLHFGLSFSALCAAGVYLVVYRRANLFATGAIVAPMATFAGSTPGTPPRRMPRPSNGRSRYFAPSWMLIRPATSLIGVNSGRLPRASLMVS